MYNIRSQLKLNNPTTIDPDRTDDASRDDHASERAGQRGEDVSVSPRTGIPEIRTVERDHGTDTDRSTGGDEMTGTGRNDRFVFTAPSDSEPGREGVDLIRDFGRGDLIDLSRIDATSTGDGVADFQIALLGQPSETESSFVF